MEQKPKPLGGDRIMVPEGIVNSDGALLEPGIYTLVDATATTKKRCGFAVLSPERQRAIASLGGKASHKNGRGHEWTREEAREAGRKGGAVVGKNRRKAP